MNIKYKFSCFEAKSWRLSLGENSIVDIRLKALGIVGICEGLNFTNRLGVDDILQAEMA